MIFRAWLCAGVIFLGPTLCLAQESTAASQVEAARQFAPGDRAPQQQTTADNQDLALGSAPLEGDDDSFGDQQILKSAPRVQPFDVYAGTTAFFTNNVALTDKDHHSDSFLSAIFGFSATRNILQNLQLQLTGAAGLIRYSKYYTFDVDSTDIGISAIWQIPRLWNAAAYAQYDYSDLFQGQNGHEFFSNHSIIVGVQKTVPINRAQSVTAGVSANFNISSPETLQRDEYAVYAGYNLQITHYLDGSLLYHYGYQRYSEEGRHDNNQSLEVTFRYAASTWLEILATTYFTINRSNYQVYNYNALEGGLGLNAEMKF